MLVYRSVTLPGIPGFSGLLHQKTHSLGFRAESRAGWTSMPGKAINKKKMKPRTEDPRIFCFFFGRFVWVSFLGDFFGCCFFFVFFFLGGEGFEPRDFKGVGAEPTFFGGWNGCVFNRVWKLFVFVFFGSFAVHPTTINSLPKFNSSPLKMDGWSWNFPRFLWPISIGANVSLPEGSLWFWGGRYPAGVSLKWGEVIWQFFTHRKSFHILFAQTPNLFSTDLNYALLNPFEKWSSKWESCLNRGAHLLHKSSNKK